MFSVYKNQNVLNRYVIHLEGLLPSIAFRMSGTNALDLWFADAKEGMKSQEQRLHSLDVVESQLFKPFRDVMTLVFDGSNIRGKAVCRRFSGSTNSDLALAPAEN